jgi:hypothetical protein
VLCNQYYSLQEFKKYRQSVHFYFGDGSLPCLRSLFQASTLSFVIIYVDDGGIIVTLEAIKEVIEALSKSFKVKTMGELSKFVGCHIMDTTAKEGVWIHQPKLLKNLKENIKDLIKESARVF